MEVWFTERQTDHVAISCRVRQVLHVEQSNFQQVGIIDTVEYGRMLILDNVIQTSVMDEFIYHEMITHVGLCTHPDPRRVLVIGGGDGGSVREIVKHSRVEKVVHVEIDEKVIEAAKKFLPELSSGFSDRRVEIVIGDGIEHVAAHKNAYDVIIIDSTDPVGPAVGLFTEEFYRNVYESLHEDGLFIAQTESPFLNRQLVSSVYGTVSRIFPIARVFVAVVPTYPGGFWSFTMGSKKYDPLQVKEEEIPDLNTRWYSPAIHHAAFVLPPFMEEYLSKAKRAEAGD